MRQVYRRRRLQIEHVAKGRYKWPRKNLQKLYHDKVIEKLIGTGFLRPLFICLARTGARPDELFALRWQDVSFERSEISIGHSTHQITSKHYSRYIQDNSLINERKLEDYLQSTQRITQDRATKK